MASITRWRPFESSLGRLRPFDDFNQLFPRDFFSRLMPDGELAVEWNPRCDVTEEDKEIVIHAELPGVKAEDISVEVKDSTLTIKGEKKTEKSEQKDGGQSYSERFFGSFQRSMAIPNVDVDNIQAEMKDGVLELRLPKMAPVEPAPKKIEIKAKS